MKQIYRSVIDRISGRYGQITILSGVMFAISVAWSKMPMVFNEYRPDDHLLFLVMVAAPLLATIVSVARSESDAYKIEDIEKKNKDSIEFFQNELIELRKEILNRHLWEISEGLSFSMQERICVYRFLEKEDGFECIGRYSAHPEYRNPSTRNRYPLKSGVIGHVWNNGESNGFTRDNKFPCPKNKKELYFKYVDEEYGISYKVAKRFRMNAIDIIAEILRDVKDKPIAVIVFESQRKNFIDQEKIYQYYNEHKKKVIIDLLENLKEQNPPDINIAKEARL